MEIQQMIHKLYMSMILFTYFSVSNLFRNMGALVFDIGAMTVLL
jgi:hypothetical protein